MTLDGRLRARFTATGGRVVARVSATAPLELRGPFEGARLPRYFLRNVTAGMLDGDAYCVDVCAEPDVHVAIAPTSASKAFVARGLGASTVLRLEAQAGALLDFDAGTLIPHTGSVLRQSTEIVVHPGARVAYAEVLSFGRAARGERFAFERLVSELRVLTPDGAVRFEKRSDLAPSATRAVLEAAVGAYRSVGTLLLLGDAFTSDGATLPEASPEACYAGVSALPHGVGLVVQALADWPETATTFLATVKERALALSACQVIEAATTTPAPARAR